MKPEEGKNRIRSLFEKGSETHPQPDLKQEIKDRKGEAKRVVKRLFAIFEDHKDAAFPLKIKLGSADLHLVINALREHARGGEGLPVPGSREEIHGYCKQEIVLIGREMDQQSLTAILDECLLTGDELSTDGKNGISILVIHSQNGMSWKT
jgi:hypothetical protein